VCHLEILVVSADGSYIFSLTELSWRVGPPMPEELYRLTSVQLDDGFMIVGGIDTDYESSSQSVHTIDSNYNWSSNREGLSGTLDYTAGVKIPDEFLNC